MSVKIAVVPPIPKASVSTAAIVKTGDCRNWRKAYRILLKRFRIPFPYLPAEMSWFEFLNDPLATAAALRNNPLDDVLWTGDVGVCHPRFAASNGVYCLVRPDKSLS